MGAIGGGMYYKYEGRERHPHYCMQCRVTTEHYAAERTLVCERCGTKADSVRHKDQKRAEWEPK